MLRTLKATIFTVFALLAIALVAFFGSSAKDNGAYKGNDFTVSVTAASGQSVQLIKDGATDYMIVYATDMQVEQDLAGALRALFVGEGVSIGNRPLWNAQNESQYEILIGNTGRQASVELLTEINAAKANSDDLAWGFAVIGNKVVYTASDKLAFEIGKAEFIKAITDGGFVLASDFKVIKTKTLADYEAELKAEMEAQKEARIAELKSKIKGFDDSLFGVRTPMQEDYYPDPLAYPTEGQHPRLNLTADMLPEIKALLENPTYEDLAKDFWDYANAQEDGILPDVSTLKETYNWDGKVVARIEAMALAYLITGDEEYGYQAIFAAKNLMLTLNITHDIFVDIFRMYGWAMMVTGEVYDWCYDLMTEADKSQFVRGVQKYYCEDCYCGEHDKMTIGYPPTGMNAISGHATNVMLMRDYVAFSIAIYDEYPDWWELVGGRFYSDFVPANNVYYPSGMNPQGANCYVWGKFYAQLYPAWFIKVMAGEMPYDEDVETVVYGLMGLRLPNGKVFQSGDGTKYANGYSDSLQSAIYIAQALFPSEIMQRNARILTNNYRAYSYSASSNYISPTTSIIFRANGYEGEPLGDDKNEGLDLIFYYGSPMGQMTVRDSWSEDAAAVYMKIGELTNNGHDHEDAGTFQIYYKGCFTTETGLYSGATGAPFGSEHHRYWHQATISKNGLLVYNPNLASTDKGWYSGGQDNSEHSYADDVEAWISHADSIIGKVTGHDYYYRPDGSVEYAYISGDISDAYVKETVKEIGRSMLTVYTGNPEFPMIFVVYDYIESISASYTKSFLFQTTTEPTVSGNTAYFEQEDGKIVLTTLTDGAVIKTYGGAGKTYWINDTVGNCDKPEEKYGNTFDGEHIDDGAFWGRVQIDNSGNTVDHLFNVFYVTDVGNENKITPTKSYENDTVICAQTDKTVTAFIKGLSKNTRVLEFTTEGKGLQSYFVAGLSEGSWTVKVDGVTVAHAHTTADSGIIDFTAPAGFVSIEPGSDVRPANSDEIKYITNGAVLPEDTRYFYIHDEEFILPVIEDTDTLEFIGWSFSESSTDIVTEIPYGTRGVVRLYAIYNAKYTENYDKRNIDVNGSRNSTFSLGGLVYGINKKTEAKFKTVEKDGGKYLLWERGQLDPMIQMSGRLSEYAGYTHKVTFTVDLAINEGNPLMGTTFRFRAQPPNTEYNSSGTPITSAHVASIFKTKNDGTVALASGKYTVATLTEEFTTLSFSMDFDTGTLYAFDADGNYLAKDTLTLSKADQDAGYTYLEYMYYCSTLIFDWGTSSGDIANGAIKIDNLKIQGGFPENAKIPDENAPTAIVYHGVSMLPTGVPYYYSTSEPTALPENLTDSSAEFYGWYADADFTTPVYEVPVDYEGPFHAYARWKKTWSESFDDITVDAYTNDDCTDSKDDYEGKVSFNAGKNNTSTVIKTLSDGAGGQYIYWTSKKSPSIFVNGALTDYIGDDTAVTYRVRIAKSGESEPSQVYFRVQEGSSKVSLKLFQITATGEVILNGNKSFVIATLGEEFTEIIVTLDFAAATLTAYNPDGSVKVTKSGAAAVITDLAVPSGSTAKNFLDFKNKINSGLVMQTAVITADRKTELLLDDLSITSGFYGMKKQTADTTDITYEGLIGASIEGEYPKNYSRDTATALPTDIKVQNERLSFGGWYLDKEYTKPVTELPIGLKGPVTVYAKIVSYTEKPNTIVYNGVGDDALPDGTKYYHSPTEKTPLPTAVEAPDGYIFDGWYTSEEYNERVTEAPAGLSAQFIVYARFLPVFSENFDSANIDLYNKTGENNGNSYNHTSLNGITYMTNQKLGAAFKTVEDATGGKYLVWRKGNADDYAALTEEEKATTHLSSSGNPSYDPQWFKNGVLSEFLGKETALTFSVSLAKNAILDESGKVVDYDTPFGSQVQISVSGSNCIVILSTKNDGGVYLGTSAKGIKIGELKEEFTRFTVSLDFKSGEIKAYNADGTVITDQDGNEAKLNVSVPSAALTNWAQDREMTLLDWLLLPKNYLYIWRVDSSVRGAMRIDNIDFRGGVPMN